MVQQNGVKIIFISPTSHKYTRCPKKSGTLDICYFEIWKYSIFWFRQIIRLLKECYQDHMIWFSSIDSTTISWNTVIYKFFKICPSYLRRVIAVHKFSLCFVRTDQWASGQQCMESEKPLSLNEMSREWKENWQWLCIEKWP